MEMKQRIIGLIVLLALGVILVPLIFDSETVIKPARVAAVQANNPASNTNLSLAAPNKNFTPTPSIIQPGAIEASADKLLEHPSQSTAFALNEPQDFEDRDEDELKTDDIQDQIANEEESQTEFKNFETVSHQEPAAKAVKNPSINAQNLPEKAPQLKAAAAARTQSAKLSALNQKKNRSEPQNPAQGNWVIQLGSFSEVANASKLVGDLKSKGFNAFTERDHNNKNRLKVLIGPEEDRETADQTVSKLEQQHHIKSIVVRYR